ncbi:DUF488 domain-containing protein [Gordonia crocea]|uniref:MarR family transcriptional regulator n=1 Tax=Gordonia crocea TaxID=589162 RepID=A0A7I9V2W2_9ACTN|nr:DUF488 family protein [Gordonia crocea]GED99513.1 hypothetical protein nbrc107697_35520 [Gordonia crocea]
MSVTIGRVYDDVPPGVTRVLVDRLWPRGIRKGDPRIGQWCKAVAPSTQLRQWYGHDPAKFDEFARRYRAELGGGEQAQALAEIRELAAAGDVELVTATKDPDHSEVPIIVGEL